MKHPHLFFLGLFALIFTFSCSDDITLQPQAEFPEILDVLFPPKAFLADPAGIVVHARATDPQGLADIAAVVCVVQTPQSQQTELPMADDGRPGDIIKGDGQYVAMIPGSLWETQGRGHVKVKVRDAAGHETESDSYEVEILPGAPGAAPEVFNLTFPDTIESDVAAELALLVEARDANGPDDIDSVTFAIFPPVWATPSLAGVLRDDGQADDGLAGNGIFGARFANSAFIADRGIYTLRVRAIDAEGNLSKARLKYFHVVSIFENLPPVVVSVSAPDTISRNTSTPFVLRAVVSDPNGLADISRVFFNVFRPDGSAAESNPNFMRDDGVQDENGFGDITANDGEYALAIIITPTTPTGNYRFEFQAQDRAGLLSEKFVHIITVTR